MTFCGWLPLRLFLSCIKYLCFSIKSCIVWKTWLGMKILIKIKTFSRKSKSEMSLFESFSESTTLRYSLTSSHSWNFLTRVDWRMLRTDRRAYFRQNSKWTNWKRRLHKHQCSHHQSHRIHRPTLTLTMRAPSGKRRGDYWRFYWLHSIANFMFPMHRVFKKSSANGKITVYLGKRDFVDHISHVDPIGEFNCSIFNHD